MAMWRCILFSQRLFLEVGYSVEDLGAVLVMWLEFSDPVTGLGGVFLLLFRHLVGTGIGVERCFD